MLPQGRAVVPPAVPRWSGAEWGKRGCASFSTSSPWCPKNKLFSHLFATLAKQTPSLELTHYRYQELVIHLWAFDDLLTVTVQEEEWMVLWLISNVCLGTGPRVLCLMASVCPLGPGVPIVSGKGHPAVQRPPIRIAIRLLSYACQQHGSASRKAHWHRRLTYLLTSNK